MAFLVPPELAESVTSLHGWHPKVFSETLVTSKLMFYPADNILGLKEQTLFGSLLLREGTKADMLTFLWTTCCHEDSEGVFRWKQKQPENTAIALLHFHLSWAALMLGNRWSLLPATPASRKRHFYQEFSGGKNPTFIQRKLSYWLSGFTPLTASNTVCFNFALTMQLFVVLRKTDHFHPSHVIQL